ncbi:hypothetical protein [Streptomyces hawaiiensis]|uniref:Uncharacterized protein n=1 Tax=Streptomyces hawaiiensis TaxID=67305 RepID=A0A6G5RMU2_9ACTN|nr:hypothetical protein [Streptomyces hawaiiensis]QCD59096.1 hypothetical protein CEB94_32880 [Streptomyces hawaiiensis]
MTRFVVRIPGEGLAEINGELLAVGQGRSVHEAVLDRLQQYAQERAAAVEATVNDGPGGAHFVLQVAPDGSSRLLDPTERAEPADHAPEPPPPPVPAPTPASAAPIPASAAPGPAASVVTPVPAAPTPASAVATAVARARAAATAPPVPVPSPAPVPPPPPSRPLPRELADRVAHINALVRRARLEEASAEVTALREALTRTAGTEHPDALEARAMEAYLAYLRGDHREATVLALSVARILCGAGAPQAPAAVARAAAAWQRLEDDRAAEIHGRELLHMWGRLRGAGRLSPADEHLAHRVRAHVEALSSCV